MKYTKRTSAYVDLDAISYNMKEIQKHFPKGMKSCAVIKTDGYGDGYPRLLSNKASVLIRGRRAPILGRVCMDQFMVDVTDIPGAAEGDMVTLVGFDGEEQISVEELSAICGRFNYEFVCDIGKRVPRIYRNV